jgi:hypothetical protein
MPENHEQIAGGSNQAAGPLDPVLDAALAKYAAVEPRAGLEDRVLAHLQAERERVPVRAWWRWSIAGALAVAVVAALALAWRSGNPSGNPSHPAVANHSPAPAPVAKAQVAANGESRGVRTSVATPVRKSAGHREYLPAAIAAAPRLDQFPSPQPLSEQEKMLQSYVAQYPDRAVLIARARTEALRLDIEEMKAFSSSDPSADFEDLNHDTSER